MLSACVKTEQDSSSGDNTSSQTGDISSSQIDEISSVSYTHLDVYKRQDIAIALEDFSDDDLLKFYGKIDDEHMAQILEQMDEDLQQRFVALLPYKRIIALFSYMSNDDIADILGEMPMNLSLIHI